jgi:hypothetical protein
MFYAEAAAKIFAFGWQYFLDSWCRFEFFLVLSSAAFDIAQGTLDKGKYNLLPTPWCALHTAQHTLRTAHCISSLVPPSDCFSLLSSTT